MFDEHDEFGETPLHYAAMLNNTALIEWMIENGADVGIRAKDNGTPLHRALEFGSIDAAHLVRARMMRRLAVQCCAMGGLTHGGAVVGDACTG